MLATNIESEVRRILAKSKGGWLRVSECAKEFAKENASEETRFYRWRKKVEKGKVLGFQVVKLPGNISFIGLDSADPKTLESLIFEDKKTKLNFEKGLNFFDWWEKRAERKKWERENERELVNREIAEVKSRRAIYHEKFKIYQKLPLEKRNNPLPIEQEKAMEKKWRRYYGLE